MTEKELRLKVVKWVCQYKGIKEGSEKHKEILKVFNDSKLCSYKMTVKDAWCATTVSAAFIACGLAGKSGSGSLFECVQCSCGSMIELAKKQGIWNEKDNYIPKIGDIILYDWDDNGKGDCTGWPEHVGIVSSVSSKLFYVIEGNKNNTVGVRVMSVNGRYIRGYITPNYSRFATDEEKTEIIKDKVTAKESAIMLQRTISGTYKAIEDLNLRTGAGTNKDILTVIKKGTKVKNYGFYTSVNGVKWLYIQFAENGIQYTGFASEKYLNKVG